VAVEFENLEFEQIVLALMLLPDVRKQLAENQSLLTGESFSDASCQSVFEILRDFKRNVKPKRKLVLSKATFSIEPTKKTAIDGLLKRIYKKGDQLTESDVGSFTFYCEELARLTGARKMLRGLQRANERLQLNDAEGARSALLSTAKTLRDETVSIFRGDVVEDYGKHKRLIRHKIENPDEYMGISTGVDLYDQASGGLFPKELVIMLAATGVGKSVFLLEVGHNAAWQGYGVLHVTIEMDREKAQTRFYSRRSGIPHRLFRDPLGKDPEAGAQFTDEHLKTLRRSLKAFHKRGGYYYVAAFKGRTCTVPLIEEEIRRTEEKYGKRVDIVTIDYLNDLVPVGRFESDWDWNALGGISWDLSQLAKDFVHIDDAPDRPSGLCVVTANQAKMQSIGKQALNERDFAYSPLPPQHANVVVFLTRTEEDEENGTLNFGFSKARDYGTSMFGKLFPNFDIMRIHDPERQQAFEGDEVIGGQL